jgi:hypothetical protein
MTGWDFAFLVLAGLITIGWGAIEVALARHRIATRLRRLSA